MTQPFTVPGAVLELHAARAKLGESPGINDPLTTEFFDTSGEDNHGTLTNFAGTTASGYAGAGTTADPYQLAFDPAAPIDYVNRASLGLATTKTMTLEVWFRTTYAGASYPRLIYDGSPTGPPYGEVSMWIAPAGNSRLYSYSRDDDGVTSSRSGPSVPVNDGNWHHGVVTLNGVNLVAWVDGVAGGSVGIAPGVITATATRLSSLTYPFPGSIAVARVYPFALTPEQVAQNYAAGTGWLEVTTAAVTGATTTAAASGGTVLPGGETATARGVCWNATGSPTTADDKTTDGSGAGAYTSTITGLSPKTTYYVRAYATSAAGTVYGSEVTFTTRTFEKTERRHKQQRPSLLLGSDTLGWRDLGPVAAIGEMTRAMPGGDGSLEFELSARDASAARNQLRPGARVRLMVGGEGAYGGRVLSDPIRHSRSGPSDSLSIGVGGVHAWAARREDFCHVWQDADYDQWQPTVQDSQQWASDTEGRLYIGVEDGDTLAAGSFSLAYWVSAGFGEGDIDHLTFAADIKLPATLTAKVQAGTTPWGSFADTDWTKTNATTTLSGQRVPASGSFPPGTRCVRLRLTCSTKTTYTAAQHCILTDVVAHGGGNSVAFGEYGSEPGQMKVPLGLGLAPSGDVYVADSANHRVQQFTAAGAFVRAFGSNGSGDGELNYPSDVAVAASGTVYVVDQDNNRVQYFTAEGAYLGKWGSAGTGNGQFSVADSVAVAPGGAVYVTDSDLDRVQYFTATGTYSGQWGTSGSGNGEFSYPRGVAVAASGAVYVADQDNNRVQYFAADGTFTDKWGSSGSGDGQFDAPTGVAIGSGGTVFVVDRDNARVQEFEADGTYVREWNVGAGPMGAAANEYVYVSRSGYRLARVDRLITATADASVSDALAEVATRPGLAGRAEVATIGSALGHLVVRPDWPKTAADGLREVAGYHDEEVEYEFRLGADGVDVFYAQELPAAVDPTRNTHWSYGGRAGEDESGLERDTEVAPDYIRLLFLSSGISGIPNGTPVSVWHPEPPAEWDARVSVEDAYGDVVMTEAEAAALAARLWTRRQAQQWTGTVPLTATATTTAGVVRHSYHVRPGDRLSVPSLDGATDLYVVETTYNWTSHTGSATVGWPWDVSDVLRMRRVATTADRRKNKRPYRK
jgi:hypothetical protein